MLSTQDIAEMRAVAKEAMPDRVRIFRPGAEEDPMGGTVPSAPVLIGEETCAFTTNVSQNALVSDQQRTSADGLLSLPGDTTLDIRPQDRAQLVGDAVMYEVQGYAERAGRYVITKRVLVARA